MKRKFEVFHKGFRYWATLNFNNRSSVRGRPSLMFWSSHKWPFYHGHYTPDVLEPEDAWQHFTGWLPYD